LFDDDLEQFRITYDNNTSSWRNILIGQKWIKPVCNLFNIIENIEDIKSFDFNTCELKNCGNEKLKLSYSDLCKTTLLVNICPGCEFHWWQNEQYSLYPYATKQKKNIYVIGNNRNQVLADLHNQGIIIDCDQKIPNSPYFWGWEIDFTYNSEKYRWGRDDKLHKKNDNDWIAENGDNPNSIVNYIKNKYPLLSMLTA
jgi:hypothetical protein